MTGAGLYLPRAAMLSQIAPALHHPIITGILLGAAVLLALACSIGLLAMRDVFQRLHFTTPPAMICSLLIAVAVWIEDSDPQARLKITLIFALMCLMNAALNHATARAAFIRRRSAWEPVEEDQIPLVRADGSRSGRVAVVEGENVRVIAESRESGGSRNKVPAGEAGKEPS